MNSAAENLALRKQILLARSALGRLRVAHQLSAIHDSLRWPRVGMAVAGSPPARSALLGLLVLVAGEGRVARLLRGAAAALMLAKLARVLAALLKR
jgi:hypothetical protein